VLREFDHLAPDAEVFLVAALKFHQLAPRGFEHGGIRLAGGVDGLVEPLHLADGIAVQGRAVELLLPSDQQLAELRAPVADVIVRHHTMTEQAQGAGETVTENGRADMADVHRLGHVRRAEIHDHHARLRRLLKKQMFAAHRRFERLREGRGLQPEIEEARPGNLHLFTPLAHVEIRDHLGRELARVHLPLLGQRHQRVGLVIAELRIRAWPDEDRGGGRLGQHRGHGLPQTLFKKKVKHGNGGGRRAGRSALARAWCPSAR